MTDRYKGVIVTFEEDIRSDDAELIVAAIRQIRGVAGVEPSVTTSDDRMNRTMVRIELEKRLWKALEQKP